MRKIWLACAMLGLAAGTAAVAQNAPAPAASAPAARALRPPNLPNPAGTDSGAGPDCSQLTAYGEVQPHGPASKPYGLGAPPPAAPAPLPAYAQAIPARADSVLGASGIKARGVTIPDAPVLPFKFMPAPQPPQGTAGFANVNGVGLLKDGRLVVVQRLPMYEILVYDAQGRLQRNLDPNIIARPHGMRIDKDENIWLTDQQCNIVVKMNVNGDVLMRLGTTGKAGTWDEAKGDHLFNQPTDIAFGPTGDIFVSTGHGGPDPRILRFDRNGKFITTWSLKHADGSPATIHTLVVDKNGQVFAGDREAKVLRVFESNGRPIRDIPMKQLICGLYIDAKNQLWMSTGMDGMVLKLGWDGKVLGFVGKSGFDEYEFGEAHYMTMSADGKTMFVGDTVNNNIKKLVLN